MIDKREARTRRAAQTRARQRSRGVVRLAVTRTNQHIYAQVISSDGAKVLAAASTAEKEVRGQLPNGSNRAAASVGPDHAVVEELEQAAVRARRRSGFVAASLAYERAAALTPDESERARLLTAAAETAWFGGRLERARMLLERARPLAWEPLQRADIDRYLGLVELTGGVPAEACRFLIHLANLRGGPDNITVVIVRINVTPEIILAQPVFVLRVFNCFRIISFFHHVGTTNTKSVT